MKDKKDDKVKIEVSTYNWGPCVVKVKILDDFKKVLLEEARKNEEDYASKLAGQIRKETGYSEESRGKLYHTYHHTLVCMMWRFKDTRIKNTSLVNQSMH